MSTPLGGWVFLSMCQHAVGNETLGIGGPPISVLRTFYRERLIVELQHAHAISILKRVIVVGEGFSRLGVLSRGSPLSLFDMLLTIGKGLET
jgi:hypothetical protein